MMSLRRNGQAPLHSATLLFRARCLFSFDRQNTLMHKLTYFDVEARAEPIRIMLHAAGIPFEDERVDGEAYGQAKAAGMFSTGFPSPLAAAAEGHCVAGCRY